MLISAIAECVSRTSRPLMTLWYNSLNTRWTIYLSDVCYLSVPLPPTHPRKAVFLQRCQFFMELQLCYSLHKSAIFLSTRISWEPQNIKTVIHFASADLKKKGKYGTSVSNVLHSICWGILPSLFSRTKLNSTHSQPLKMNPGKPEVKTKMFRTEMPSVVIPVYYLS